MNTVLGRLAKMAKEAKRRGDEAPTFDLCHVSVPHTNLFCAEAVKTKEFPNGIPRIKMPQFSGFPLSGTG